MVAFVLLLFTLSFLSHTVKVTFFIFAEFNGQLRNVFTFFKVFIRVHTLVMASLMSSSLEAALPIWKLIFSTIIRETALNHLCFVKGQGDVVYSILVTFKIDVAPVKMVNSWSREETFNSSNAILALLDLLRVLCRAVSLPLVKLSVYRYVRTTQSHVKSDSLFLMGIMEFKVASIFVDYLLGPHLLFLMPAQVKEKLKQFKNTGLTNSALQFTQPKIGKTKQSKRENDAKVSQ